MTPEEKAKRYDETLEQLKGLIEGIREDKRAIMEEDIIDIFYELKESEDEMVEKIRKDIISYLNNRQITSIAESSAIERWIDWLEKQRDKPKKVSIWKHWKDGIAGNGDGKQIYLIKTGNIYDISSCLGCECDYIELSELDELTREEKQMEQKSVDKFIPKFNIGDFIVNDYCFGKVIEITNDAYLLDTGQGIPFSCEHNAHLWTIADAKEGDVLATKNDVFIFKHMDKTGLSLCKSYCEVIGNSKLGFGFYFSINGVHPATKEQRDLLFQKIREAGCEWDTEKKELRKIEQVSAWSEDDEGRLDIICGLLKDIPSHQIWLKGLKNRIMLMQKVTCNEKDKEKLEMIINKASYNCLLKNDDISFLKSLKHRLQ